MDHLRRLIMFKGKRLDREKAEKLAILDNSGLDNKKSANTNIKEKNEHNI